VAARPRHPKKEVEDAVAYAEHRGWTWLKVAGHAWGKLHCRHRGRDGCTIFVWSTPRSPGNHARQIRREVDRCPHWTEGEQSHEDI
jgi:hypothetical protein